MLERKRPFSRMLKNKIEMVSLMIYKQVPKFCIVHNVYCKHADRALLKEFVLVRLRW